MKWKIAIAVLVLVIVGAAASLVIYHQNGFTGVRIKNPDSYTLDIQRMHGKDRHTMTLTAGDVLQVKFKTEKGSLHMTITAPDGAALYTGNGEAATEFELGIPQSGTYTVTVEARHAKGSIQLSLKSGGE